MQGILSEEIEKYEKTHNLKGFLLPEVWWNRLTTVHTHTHNDDHTEVKKTLLKKWGREGIPYIFK